MSNPICPPCAPVPPLFSNPALSAEPPSPDHDSPWCYSYGGAPAAQGHTHTAWSNTRGFWEATVTFFDADGVDVTASVADYATVSCVGVSAPAPAASRRLTAPLTLYVRTDGSDTNDGTADDAAHAFASTRKALQVAQSYDRSEFIVRIVIAAGDYTSAAASPQQVMGGQGYAYSPEWYKVRNLDIVGATGNADDVIIDPIQGHHAFFYLSNLTLAAENLGVCLTLLHMSDVGCYNVKFRGAQYGGVKLYSTSQFVAFSCRAENCVVAPGAAFMLCLFGSNAEFYDGFSATGCTGQRFLVEYNGIINSNGAGPNGLPGDAAGVETTGGKYY